MYTIYCAVEEMRMLYVVKRDGREVEFNADKISQAIKGSASEIGINLKESEVLDTVKKNN